MKQSYSTMLLSAALLLGLAAGVDNYLDMNGWTLLKFGYSLPGKVSKISIFLLLEQHLHAFQRACMGQDPELPPTRTVSMDTLADQPIVPRL